MHPDQSSDPLKTRHLTQRDLALRWLKSEATLERYRSEGVGPRFLKIGGAVRYRLKDIEQFELDCLYDSSHSRCDMAGCPMAQGAAA